MLGTCLSPPPPSYGLNIWICFVFFNGISTFRVIYCQCDPWRRRLIVLLIPSLGGKKAHAFLEGISHKVNVVLRLEFAPAYNVVKEQLVSHLAANTNSGLKSRIISTGTALTLNNPKRLIYHKTKKLIRLPIFLIYKFFSWFNFLYCKVPCHFSHFVSLMEETELLSLTV